MTSAPIVRLLVALAGAAAVPLGLQDQSPDFLKEVRPFLEQHCIECHDGADSEGDFDLRPQLDEATARDSFDDWDFLRERVLDGDMPPRSRPRPADTDVDSFLSWIDAAHGPVDLRFRPLDPGRPVVRRLNAREYRNTVRAWTGVDYPAEDRFPADTVGYGFDHIGAALSLPQDLLEKYLDAAEEIADQAILRWPEEGPQPQRFAADALEGGDGRFGVRGLYSRTTTSAKLFVRHPGEYRVTIEAYGTQAGDEACRMGLSVNRTQVDSIEVPHERAAPGSFTRTVQLPKGQVEIGVSFLNDYYVENVADRNLFVLAVEVEGPLQTPLLPAFHAVLLQRFPEDLGKSRRDRIVHDMMERAWRRPVSEAERKRLTRSLPDDAPLATQLHQALVTLLVTPHFLFRLEADEPVLSEAQEELVRAQLTRDQPLRSQVRALDSWEMATRLSYFLTSGPPDHALRARAAEQALLDGEALKAEVDRLIATPASRQFVENFAGQWLQLRNLDRIAVDTERFPDWDAELRDAMKQESFLLFETVLREDLDVRTLLDAEFSFVNERLAQHYGIGDVRGAEPQRVSLAGAPRAGLLGHASILTLTSNPARTSPVKRGKWILENLLGAPPPPPPPEADALDESKAGTAASLREELAEHRANPSCAVCHDAMDPLGLGLEQFDAIGSFRTEDGGVAIDASGVLPDGNRFENAAELRALLRDDPAFVRALTERLLVYALGRGLERTDRDSVRRILATLPETPTLRAILHGIVESPAFRLRRTAP